MIKGTEYLHKKEIDHHDIKGQNLLVDAKGNVKVDDHLMAGADGIAQVGAGQFLLVIEHGV